MWDMTGTWLLKVLLRVAHTRFDLPWIRGKSVQVTSKECRT